MDSRTSEAQSVADIVRQAQAPLINVDRKGVAIFPTTGQVVSLENELLDANPKRKRAAVSLYEAESFIDYIKRFAIKDRSIIFGAANETGGSFKSVLDYHDAEGAVPNNANWGEHTCALVLATTPEWARWLGQNNKPMTQEQFAEFIEDNAPDIITPDAAVLLDMATLLQGKKSVTFKSSRNLRNGSIELSYSERIEETSGSRDDAMQLPDRIVVKMMPFVGCAGVEIPARLRFRISDSGKVSFTYILDRPFKVLEAAFNAVAAQVESETGIPVMLGAGAVTPPPAIK